MKKRDRKEYLKQYYLKNREAALEARKQYYQDNKEKCIEYAKEYREENKTELLAKRAAYYKKNRDSCLESSRQHRLKNKGIYNFYGRTYKLRKKQRTPKWVTEKDVSIMKCYYDLANRLTSCLGIPFEVDHIVPLCGKVVSGLHVPQNLRVITKKENNFKSNKYNIKI